MAAEFNQSTRTEAGSRSEQLAAKPGDVECDVCTGVKRKAVKSCQKCKASYCQTHIRPHMKNARLRSHQLTHLVDNPEEEEEMCKKHNKPVKLFCKTDRTCVCRLCPILDHKNHEFAPLQEQYEVRTLETLAEIQKNIKRTEQQIQEAKESVILKREASDRRMAEGVQVYTALKHGVEKGREDFMRTVEERQQNLEKHTQEVIKQLEQQLSEMMESSGPNLHLMMGEQTPPL
ncbi:zinc finger protein RFP-like [Genypterus blacodes]|uniref:zinc finger protein RFP-like n=1 Tax=Genypterus blacodes TaxID=154954 RepID=UPI003F764A58